MLRRLEGREGPAHGRRFRDVGGHGPEKAGALRGARHFADCRQRLSPVRGQSRPGDEHGELVDRRGGLDLHPAQAARVPAPGPHPGADEKNPVPRRDWNAHPDYCRRRGCLVAPPPMRKKYNNTIIAAFVLIFLTGGYVLYSRHKSSEPAKTETKTEEKLLALASSHVQSFTLSPRGGVAVTCAKSGAVWTSPAPKHLPADSTTVTSLLDTLTGATVNEAIEQNPKSLKDYGLDPPAQTLRVETDSKPAQFEIKLGDDTPTSSGVYAQLGGSPRVVTLAAYLKTSLVKSLFDLRDKRAVTLGPEQIRKIVAQSK